MWLERRTSYATFQASISNAFCAVAEKPSGGDTNPLGRGGLALAGTGHIASFGGTAERVVRPAIPQPIAVQEHDYQAGGPGQAGQVAGRKSALPASANPSTTLPLI